MGCEYFVRFVARCTIGILGVGVIITQGLCLDHYLATHNGPSWYWWISVDVLVSILFILATYKSLHYLHNHRSTSAGEHSASATSGSTREPPDEEQPVLPLGLAVWLVYGIMLDVKIVCLFVEIAQLLPKDAFYGPTLLKTTIACSSFVFILLVSLHHETKDGSYQNSVIKELTSSSTMDILDTVALLQILFVSETHILLTYEMHRAILTIVCINVLLPVLSLTIVSYTPITRHRSQKRLRCLHLLQKCCSLCLVNIPMFVIRLLLWTMYTHDVSIFIIKNVLGILFALRAIALEAMATCRAEDKNNRNEKKSSVDLEMEQLHPPAAVVPAASTRESGSSDDEQTDTRARDGSHVYRRATHDSSQPGTRDNRDGEQTSPVAYV